jgi:RimJ/RimL family protein N-acetyltransferase
MTTLEQLAQYWPPARLRIVGPRVELRMATDAELLQLIELIDSGVHDPEMMPFSGPWTDSEPAARARGALAWYWQCRASMDTNAWNLQLAVFVEGEPVGVQDVMSAKFRATGAVKTGSWLAMKHHGSGIGTEMREAVLALAFDGLGARCALTEAYVDNPASIRVSEKCGYMRSGEMPTERLRGPQAPGGASSEIVEMCKFRLDADDWRARTDRPAFTITGLDADLRVMVGAAD